MSQTASAQLLLSDNFTAASAEDDVNAPNNGINGTGRQTGTDAGSLYTANNSSDANGIQIGNTTTNVGQPNPADGNYGLVAFGDSFYNNLDVASAANTANAPLTISFNLWTSGNPFNADPSNWGAFTLSSAGTSFPVVAGGQFAFLQRVTEGVQVFNNGVNPTGTAGFDTAGFASTTGQWTLVFSNTAGTGSAFNGTGSEVTMINNGVNDGTFTLTQLNSSGLFAGFTSAGGGMAIGVDNLSISLAAAVPEPSTYALLGGSLALLAFVALRRKQVSVS